VIKEEKLPLLLTSKGKIKMKQLVVCYIKTTTVFNRERERSVMYGK
tara:strand:- start:579 stop:716 length:138 start_codon:yes stop_codon:yes gene_type:complete